jgi:hypothetical protein
MNIGILIPLCSRNQDWKNVYDIDFFNSFLPFFYGSISNKYNYKFYLGIDENDKFLIDCKKDIEKCLNKEDKIIILPKSLNGNPYGCWSVLLECAIDECDYFYQCGSDIGHLTKNWDSYFIRVLQKNNNVGITGGVHKQFWLERTLRNQNGILENVFFHKTHWKIFKRFMNPKFKAWRGDDAISQTYREHNSTFISSNHLYINSNRVGNENSKNRYEPNDSLRDTWLDIAKEDSKLITEYLKKNKN